VFVASILALFWPFAIDTVDEARRCIAYYDWCLSIALLNIAI
jgi:hypothetical protein